MTFNPLLKFHLEMALLPLQEVKHSVCNGVGTIWLNRSVDASSCIAENE